MNEAEKEFLRRVTEAIEVKDPERLSDAVGDFSSFCFKETPPAAEAPLLSEDLVAEIQKLIGSSNFLELDDSFKLLALFQNDWGRIRPELRPQLCRFLANLYEKLRDDTGQLVIAELLGDYLASADSLAALDKLSAAKSEVARAHVAHGYKCLALQAADPELRSKAKARLTGMAQDASEVVRQEVAAALADMAH